MILRLLFRRRVARPDPLRTFRRFLRLLERRLAPRGGAPFAGAAAREKA